MILCIGTTPTLQRSMTFDHLKVDDVNRAREVSEYASGKSINVARVLKSLGHSPFCTGFLGGPRGALIRQDLDALAIQHDFVQVLPPPASAPPSSTAPPTPRPSWSRNPPKSKPPPGPPSTTPSNPTAQSPKSGSSPAP